MQLNPDDGREPQAGLENSATDDVRRGTEEMTAAMRRVDVDDIPIRLPFQAIWMSEDEQQ